MFLYVFVVFFMWVFLGSGGFFMSLSYFSFKLIYLFNRHISCQSLYTLICNFLNVVFDHGWGGSVFVIFFALNFIKYNIYTVNLG